MQGKRDQLQAHLFVVGRMTSALLRADPDQPERPLRRTATGGVVGVVVSVALLVGFGVYGLTGRGSSTSWRSASNIIIEKETGTRYLFLDGTLRPALNYTSARLAVGGQDNNVKTVNRKSLAGVPHGRPIGIPGAPDSLPKATDLLGSAWLACAISIDRTGQEAKPGLAVALGDRIATQEQAAGRGALVADEQGTNYLVTQGQRLKLPSTTTARALGYGATPARKVASAWLNGFSVGPDLVAPTVPNRGQNGPNIGGKSTKIGQVLTSPVPGGQAEYYLVMPDGLLLIGETLGRLLLADPASDKQVGGTFEITSAVALSTPQSKSNLPVSGYPSVPPKPIDTADQTMTLCVRLSFDTDHGMTAGLVTASAQQVRSMTTAVSSTATTVAAPSANPAASAAAGGSTGGPVSSNADASVAHTADRIAIESGKGALVVGQASAGVSTGTVYLVTDLGMKFPLPTDDVVNTLGYAGRTRTPTPTTVLELLPTGPTLDPASARKEA